MKRLQMKFQDNLGNKKMMSLTNIKEDVNKEAVEKAAAEIIAAKVFKAKEGLFETFTKAEIVETNKTVIVDKEN